MMDSQLILDIDGLIGALVAEWGIEVGWQKALAITGEAVHEHNPLKALAYHVAAQRMKRIKEQ
jgi:hypothetical protein